MDSIETYLDSGLAVITMIKSSIGNPLNQDSLEELSSAFDSSINNGDVKAVMLRSDGKIFCLGMDLEFFQNAQEESSIVRRSVELYKDLLLKISKAPKPIVTLINGDVKGGGIGLLAASDIIVSSEKSTFEFSEVLLGLIPANVLPFILVRRISLQKAKSLILTAKKISAPQAKEIGLIDEVFPEERLEKELKTIMKNIFRADPHALAETKYFAHSILFKDLDEACEKAKDKLIEMINLPQVRKGIKEYNDGDLPSWFSKFRPEKPLFIGGQNE